MITQVYANILDEDRKVNAQKFEDAFYACANPDLRSVRPPEQPKAPEKPQEPERSASPSLDLLGLLEQLQKIAGAGQYADRAVVGSSFRKIGRKSTVSNPLQFD